MTVGEKAFGKKAVWEEQAFGEGVAEPKGGEGTGATGAKAGEGDDTRKGRVAASSTDEASVDSSEQSVVSSKQ